MIVFAHLSTQPVMQALGWTLLHFCWQGAAIALILECALGLLPLRAAQTRYAAACAAMVAMVVLPLVTFAVLSARPHTVSSPAGFAAGIASYVSSGHGTGQLSKPWIARCEQALDQAMPAVIGFWLAGVMLLLCRLNLALSAAMRMKSRAVEPVALEMLEVMHALQAKLRISRTVRLLRSARVDTPVVIGWIRPVILFPVSCMAGLSAEQIETVLAHELAHIRRCDYLVNLLQSLVEIALFYHPAVWRVSSQMRLEREHCCDDIAVLVSCDRLGYAKALSRMEELRGPALACTVASTGGALKMRVARLLGVNRRPVFPRRAAALLLVLAVASAALLTLGTIHAQSTEPSQSQSGSPSRLMVQVRTLTIDSDDLPQPDRQQIVSLYQGRSYPLQELVERIRQEVRDRGYAKASVELLQPASAAATPSQSPTNVSVRVSAGSRYRLAKIEIVGARSVSEREILDQFPIRSGDMFNATAIGRGLTGAKNLLIAKGYTRSALIPRLQIDDVLHTVTLAVQIKEGN